MSKETFLCGFVLALASLLFLILAPGTLSLVFVALTVAATALGFYLGIFRISSFNQAFINARQELVRARTVQAENMWLALRQVPALFGCKPLDRVFDRYRHDVDAARKAKAPVLPDLEDYLNESFVGLRSWRGVVLQIPAVLTGLGIMGTFVGLIVGVGGVGFSSVTAAINGVETLLSGIEIAFYTSIVGLSLSILFNMMYRILWNIMLGNLQSFTLLFQELVIPSADDQERDQRLAFQAQVLQLLGKAR